VVEFDHYKSQAGLPGFVISVSEWIDKTDAIGIIVKKGNMGVLMPEIENQLFCNQIQNYI